MFGANDDFNTPVTPAQGTPVDVGNGWWRIDVGLTTSSTGTVTIRIQPANGDSSKSYATASGVDEIYVWGAQVNLNATLLSYVSTTTAAVWEPRFDHVYDGTSWNSVGLSVFEARTNLCVKSDDLSGWENDFGGGTTLVNNATTAPDGTTTADSITAIDGTSDGISSPAMTLVAGAAYNISGYFKWIDTTRNRIALWDSTGSTYESYIEVNWSVSGVPSTSSSSGANNIQYIDVGDGWYRISFDGNADASNTAHKFLILVDKVDGSKGLYFWGAQVEAGAFPTPYVKTAAAAVAATADNASMTGANFSSWYNATEGTLFIEMEPNVDEPAGTGVSIDDAPSNNRIQLQGASGNAAAGSTGNTTVNFFSTYGTHLLPTTKLAFAYKANDAVVTNDGAVETIDTRFILPVGSDRLHIGQDRNSLAHLNGNIANVMYWPNRLPDHMLQMLTAST